MRKVALCPNLSGGTSISDDGVEQEAVDGDGDAKQAIRRVDESRLRRRRQRRTLADVRLQQTEIGNIFERMLAARNSRRRGR